MPGSCPQSSHNVTHFILSTAGVLIIWLQMKKLRHRQFSSLAQVTLLGNVGLGFEPKLPGSRTWALNTTRDEPHGVTTSSKTPLHPLPFLQEALPFGFHEYSSTVCSLPGPALGTGDGRERNRQNLGLGERTLSPPLQACWEITRVAVSRANAGRVNTVLQPHAC